MKNWILAFILTSLPLLAAAEEAFRRNVDFEWEPIEGAKSYEIEFQKVEGDKTLPAQNFKVENAIWTGPLIPGEYKMRLRARDFRGVPGTWSPAEEFRVGLEAVRLSSPKPQEKIETRETEKREIEFKWAKTGGAEQYQLSVTSEDQSVKILKTTPDTSLDIELPVAKKYTWSVKALGMGLESDQTKLEDFILIGKKLDKPTLKKPENPFVRELSWSVPEHSENYAYSLSVFDRKTNKWQNLAQDLEFSGTSLPFDAKYKGGKYRFAIKSKAKLRQSSEIAQIEFPVRGGDRSPAAEEIATVRESIQRLSGWYGIASYLITQMDFKGTNYDYGSFANFKGIGGTGRLGLGFLSEKSPWGFLSILDMSGIYLVGEGNYTFGSLEMNAVHRLTAGDRGELRQSFGLFVKELPELIYDKATGGLKATNQLQYAGPHYSLEYWYAMTSKFGLQANAHLYLGAIGLKTPSGRAVDPSLSTQYGFFGSYRMGRRMTGLLGYTMREDNVRYKSSDDSFVPGASNDAKLTGHYLNLFMEWAL